LSEEGRRLTTDEQRERLYAARRRGELCTWCGRTLAENELVYVERVEVSLKPFTGPSTRRARRMVRCDALVGAECASPELVRRMEGREPERCEACGRPMYYAVTRATRYQAICSTRCTVRAAYAKRKAGTGAN
jgi:hypothetical protein